MVSLRWFELGVEALKRACPGRPSYGYVCPLCRRVFLPEHAHMLTREHVPPRRLAGRAIVLTCCECNSRAGGELDDEMLAQEQQLDFGLGRMTEPLPARLRTPGVDLNVEVLRSGDSLLVFGLPHQNDPAAHSAWVEELRRLARGGETEGYSCKLTPERRHYLGAARLGWLRAAYLAAFATFGYSYILSPALAVVREQLADAQARLIPMFSLTDPTAQKTERSLLLVDEPERLSPCLSVRMGRHLVLLPGTGADMGFYQRVAEMHRRHGRGPFSVSGKQLPWPTEPVFALDFCEDG